MKSEGALRSAPKGIIMTLTEARNTANQANAQHSTGPVTPEGKAISSRNALKHGLTSKTILLPGEDPAQYQALQDGMLADFQPVNVTQASHVLELVDLKWRLERASRYEARVLSAENPDFKALHNMSLHAARIKRQYSATLKELLQLQKVQSDAWDKEMAEAAILCRANHLEKKTVNFSHYGFNFTEEDVWIHLEYQSDLEDAKRTVRARYGRNAA
jgi:hypothetical protein